MTNRIPTLALLLVALTGCDPYMNRSTLYCLADGSATVAYRMPDGTWQDRTLSPAQLDSTRQTLDPVTTAKCNAQAHWASTTVKTVLIAYPTNTQIDWVEIGILAGEMGPGDSCVRAHVIPPEDLYCDDWGQ